MLEEIFNKYTFKPLINFLESIKSEIILGEIEVDDNVFFSEWVELRTKLKNGLDLKILINKREEMDWITFHFNMGLISLEDVQFMIFNNNNQEFNRIIRQDYFMVNDDVATTFNSVYTYVDDDYKSGNESIRKVSFKDISHYAGIDNLANFSCHIDGSNSGILYKEDNEMIEEKPIVSVMSTTREKQYVKCLKKH